MAGGQATAVTLAPSRGSLGGDKGGGRGAPLEPFKKHHGIEQLLSWSGMGVGTVEKVHMML